MRRPLTFDCAGSTLAGMAHPADGATAILIVTGGVQTRVGSHRGFVRLADSLALAGYPVLRFDRRGVGDSDGSDPGYRDSAPDMMAAAGALRDAFPNVRRIVGWGLCDGATALALHADALGLDGLILANPWTRDSDGQNELPPRAAIASRYRERLKNPREWVRVLRHGVNVGQAAKGLLRLAKPEPIPAIAARTADALRRFDKPALILLAERDATAQAFAALWQSKTFSKLRSRADFTVQVVADASHTFARAAEADAMERMCRNWLSKLEA